MIELYKKLMIKKRKIDILLLFIINEKIIL